MEFIKDNFGPITNLCLVLVIPLYGAVAWLRNPTINGYRKMTYWWWWCAWLAWIPAWLLIVLKARIYGQPQIAGLHLSYDIPILLFDNLNSLCLVIVCLCLTLGNVFDNNQSARTAIRLGGMVGAACFVIYLLAFYDSTTAYYMHQTCSLTLGIMTPILVGWACKLRYNTDLLLVVGLPYGLMQPLIYSTALMTQASTASLSKLMPIVTMSLAGLKIVWAIIFTQVLANGYSNGGSVLATNTPFRFHFFKRWERTVLRQVLFLAIVYSFLLVIMFLLLQDALGDNLKSVADAVVLLGTLIGIIDVFWSFWDRGRKK